MREPVKIKVNTFAAYVVRGIFRVLVLATVLVTYFVNPKYFDLILTSKVLLKWQASGLPIEELYETLKQHNMIWVYIIWAILMISMLIQMIPANRYITIGSRKHFASVYQKEENYDKAALYEHVVKSNLGALRVMLIWFLFNSVFGILYVFDVIEAKELILLSVFFYVCDLICVVIWCPFQSFIMKNRCCVNCRIFNWGNLMMFTPLLFVRNFFTWSLFFMSLLLVIRWEFTIVKHPERFWDGSNKVLQCENCQDKLCKIKGPKFVDNARYGVNAKADTAAAAGTENVQP